MGGIGMTDSGLKRHLSYLRFNDAFVHLRRVLGLRYLSANDFLPEYPQADLERLATIARRVRGETMPPAVFVLGVLPRSGTNFVRDALALHPALFPNPRRIWEFPLLDVARGANALQEEFLAMFPRNAEVMGPLDMFGYLAGAWMRDLQADAPDGRRILLKNPHMRNLSLATAAFPGDKLVLVIRDGRDVVESSLKTFSGRRLARKTFAQIAEEWSLASSAALAFAEGGPRTHPDVTVLRYEDLVTDPRRTLPGLLRRLDLDPDAVDLDAVEALPVRGSSRTVADGRTGWKPQPRDTGFNPIRRWESWPAPRKRLFDRIAGDAISKAGYATTS